MNKYVFAFVFMFLPSVAFAGGWFNDVADTIGRAKVTEITGVDVTKQSGQQQIIAEGSLQQGAITKACGCNGNVQLGATRQNQLCASGVDVVALCKGRCQRGGSPWAMVCQ